MKREVFENYVEIVAKEFGIPTEMIFLKSKDRAISTARHMLYYVCYKRPMGFSLIRNLMNENGYDVGHSSIIYGIEKTKNRIVDDKDYSKTFNRILRIIQQENL